MFGLPSALIKMAIKVRSKKRNFEAYMELNDDIMTLVQDIEELKFSNDDEKVAAKIKYLESSKRQLEKKLNEIEEEFYDVSKGLWIGVAYDLDDVDAPPFLLYLPWKNLHNHIEVFGTSGYGKSRLMALFVRQFIHNNWSCFVVDPKGGDKQEVAQWVYDFAAEAGLEHLIMRIMPTYPALSDKGNPIFGMSDVEIASLCSSLVVSSTGAQSSDEQFFSGQVYRTTYAILSASTYLESALDPYKIETNKQIKDEVQKYLDFKERKNIESVYEDETISIPDPATISRAQTNTYETKTAISPFNRTLITFRELAYYTMFDNLNQLQKIVQDTPVPKIESDMGKTHEITALREMALRALYEITSMEKAFYEKTGTSLSVLLSQLAYGPVGEVMCDVRINPLVQRARNEEGMIVIFQPAPMRFEKVSEISIKIYTRMWLSLFGTVGSSGRGIAKRIVYVVDEAKPMMFPGIEEIYNKARQLGMTIVALYQSKSDLKFKLGEVLADIVQDNTATSITMKQVSVTSRQEVAQSFGTAKRAENIQMTEMDGGGRSTVIYNDVEIVNEEDINNLGIGEGYVQHYGRKYYVKFPYQRDPMPINVVMPKLEAETAYETLAQFETMLKTQEQTTKKINQEEEKKGITHEIK